MAKKIKSISKNGFSLKTLTLKQSKKKLNVTIISLLLTYTHFSIFQPLKKREYIC